MPPHISTFYRDIKELAFSLSGTLPPKGPDFFVTGASRSGTTYLYNLLKSHPDIFMPRRKEQHYFDHDTRYRENLRGLRSFFRGYKNEKCIGEVTPFYFYAGMMYNQNDVIELTNDSSISRIHKHFPEARIIVSLRDPFSRLLSMYKKNYYQGKIKTGLQDTLLGELERNTWPNLVYRNRYEVHLKNILDHFPIPTTKILIFEEWTQNQTATLSELCTFLDISENTTESEIQPESLNSAEKYQNKSRKKNIAQHTEPDLTLDEESYHKIHEALEHGRLYVEDILGRPVPWDREKEQGTNAQVNN